MNSQHSNRHHARGYGKAAPIPPQPPRQAPAHQPQQAVYQGQTVLGPPPEGPRQQPYYQPQRPPIGTAAILGMGRANIFSPSGGFFERTETPTNGLGGSVQPTQPSAQVTDEMYRQRVVNYISSKSANYCQMLIDHHPHIQPEIEAAFRCFEDPNNSGMYDPIVREFLNDVKSKPEIYVNICRYTTLFYVSILSNMMIYQGFNFDQADNEFLTKKLMSTFIDSLALWFGQWLENHQESVNHYLHLGAPFKQQYIEFEKVIDRMRISLESIQAPNQLLYFPWTTGVFDRISKKMNTGFDSYNTMFLVHPEHQNVEPPSSPSLYQVYETPVDNTGKYAGLVAWVNSIARANQEENKFAVPTAPQTVNPYGEPSPEFYRPMQENRMSHKENMMELTQVLKDITSENRFETRFDPSKYFVNIPGTDEYIIHPLHFKYISAVLTYMGSSNPYHKNAYLEKGYMPVVTLDWENGAYNYKNIFVGDEMANFILSNPEEILPQLNKAAPAPYEYDDEFSDLSELVKENSVVLKKCEELGKLPKIVYASKPSVVYSNEDIPDVINAAKEVINSKLRYKPDVIVLPLISRATTTIDDNWAFTYEEFITKVPQLVTGAEIKMDGYSHLKSIKNKVEGFSSDELKGFIFRHISSVINRWLVEAHFFSANKEDPNYLQVGNVFDDIDAFKRKLESVGGSASREFMRLSTNEFLKENITMFAPLEDYKVYAEKQLELIDDEVLKEGRRTTLKKTLLVEKRYAITLIEPATPYSGNEPMVISGSEVPKMNWIINNVPEKLRKHFNRDVPIAIKFGKDKGFRLWAATKSAYCNSKTTITPVNVHTTMALFDVTRS